MSLVKMDCVNKQNSFSWAALGLQATLIALKQPYTVSITLMQLGFVPIKKPVHLRSVNVILQKFDCPRNLVLNLFEYTKCISRDGGWKTCFTGLVPRLLGNIASKLITTKMTRFLGFPEPKESSSSTYKLSFEMVYATVHVVVTQPFHVLAIRMIASLIGKEKMYNNIFGAFWEIYKHEGIKGFFAGMKPRLLFELGGLVVAGLITHVIRKYLAPKHKSENYEGIVKLTSFVACSPLNLVATRMAVSGSQLLAGRPPFMPADITWFECLIFLHQRGELQKGGLFYSPKVDHKIELFQPLFKLTYSLRKS